MLPDVNILCISLEKTYYFEIPANLSVTLDYCVTALIVNFERAVYCLVRRHMQEL